MTVTIELKPEVETRVAEQAAARGVSVEEYIEGVLESHALRPSLDEILAPVRLEFQECGMTEDELGELLKTERRAMWEERHGGRA
ncbi:MAG: hypothetical protein H0W76_08625 [Pyrinomonadaceae bacterium]|nr:hypothetical protein [Pyrinomonadaceae bacterium]